MSATEGAPAICNACHETIQGKIVTALGKKWHPDHFACRTCKKPISGEKFHQRDGYVHCVPCYTKHFCPRCHGCQQPITDRVVQALGVSWHGEHFACGTCGKPLAGGGFMEQAGRPYCSLCYDRCVYLCFQRVVQALGVSWHGEHFACGTCGKPLAGGGFMEQAGRPYCSLCYSDKFAARCKGCGQPIVDKAIVALDAKWHRDCFKCLKCKKPVTDTTFQVQDNQPLCGKC